MAAAVMSLLALAAGAWGTRAWARAHERSKRMATGEIEVRISSPAPVALYRARDTLDTATRLEAPSAIQWLPPANYFAGVEHGGWTLWFPAPLAAQFRGPDRDGAFAITVRAPAFSAPPTLEEAPAGFVLVPAGPFLLGDSKNPGESHFVHVTTFFAGAFEVTNGEFRRFLADPRGYDTRENWTAEGWQWKLRDSSQATALLTPADDDFARFGPDDHPVVLVTWFEANAYARWLTHRLGGDRWLFRLPTEAEWEKAARGPDGFDYGLGTALSEPQAGVYNWRKNPGAEVTVVGFEETARRFRPNRYGVYHASGNAGEWIQSVSRPHNRKRPYRDDDRNLDATPGMRTTRGGSWYSATTSRLHLAYREEFQPELSSNDLGFRLVALPLPGGAPGQR